MAESDADYDIASYEKEVSQQKTLARNEEQYLNVVRESFQEVTRNEHMRRVMFELLKFCGFFSAVVPEETKMAHAEGKRLVGIFLKMNLDVIDTQLFYEILSEGVRYEEGVLKSE